MQNVFSTFRISFHGFLKRYWQLEYNAIDLSSKVKTSSAETKEIRTYMIYLFQNDRTRYVIVICSVKVNR